MKRAKLVLNFNNDTAEILGQNVMLHITSSGHYCVPLCNTLIMENVLNTNIVLHTEPLQYMSNDKKMKMAVKLHKQFAHTSKEIVYSSTPRSSPPIMAQYQLGINTAYKSSGFWIGSQDQLS